MEKEKIWMPCMKEKFFVLLHCHKDDDSKLLK